MECSVTTVIRAESIEKWLQLWGSLLSVKGCLDISNIQPMDFTGCMLFYADKHIAGYILYREYGGRMVYIDQLCTSATYTKRGFAAHMVARLMKMHAGKEFTAFAVNDGSRRFFSALKFESLDNTVAAQMAIM